MPLHKKTPYWIFFHRAKAYKTRKQRNFVPVLIASYRASNIFRRRLLSTRKCWANSRCHVCHASVHICSTTFMNRDSWGDSRVRAQSTGPNRLFSWESSSLESESQLDALVVRAHRRSRGPLIARRTRAIHATSINARRKIEVVATDAAPSQPRHLEICESTKWRAERQ